MHPLVAQIHPSFRTALFACLVGRSALYLALHASGVDVLTAESSGGLFVEWIQVVRELANAHVESAAQAGDWLRLIVNEVALFAGLVGLYRFIRRDAMPQGADRAVWLAACSPLMILTVPGSDWALVFCIAMWALELGGAGLAVWGTLVYLVGIAARPELLVLWPGFAAVCWRAGTRDSFATWFAILGPVLAFAARVLWAVLFGDPDSLYAYDARWRSGFAWQGWAAHLNDIGIAGACALGVGLAIKYASRRPTSWLWMALACLIWPLLHEPSTAAAGTMLVCAASFGHLGAFTEDPGRERLVLSMSLVALVAVALM